VKRHYKIFVYVCFGALQFYLGCELLNRVMDLKGFLSKLSKVGQKGKVDPKGNVGILPKLGWALISK
jgi:hypothetical protein